MKVHAAPRGQRRGPAFFGVLVLALLSAPFPDPPPARSQDSATYSLRRLTVTSGAGRASSASFDAVITTGQEVPAGSASRCNAGFGAALGFWSALGETPVPNWLALSHNGLDRSHVDLTWSGTAQRFDVYRSESMNTLFDPGHLFATTTGCAAFDGEPLAGSIYYYSVIPAPE